MRVEVETHCPVNGSRAHPLTHARTDSVPLVRCQAQETPASGASERVGMGEMRPLYLHFSETDIVSHICVTIRMRAPEILDVAARTRVIRPKQMRPKTIS
jgi:hypothetical protein